MANKPPRPLRLGNVVRDPVTKIQGVAVQYIESLNGNVQLAVQPETEKKDKNKLMDAYNFDLHFLEYVSDGLVDKVVPAPTVHVNLGDKVKSTISDVVGIANQKVTFMNGCVYFNIQPKIKDEKAADAPKSSYLSFEQLEVVEAGAFKPAAPLAPAPAVAPPVPAVRGTGGPTTRSLRV